MLDDYKDKQNVAYQLMVNAIKSNHISHAYLIDENNCSESFDIMMAFVKEILSINLSDNEKLILHKRIDEGNYPEIKIIEPDGMLIKKQQILDLQQEFSRSAIEGNKRIYIIRDVDKMRNETSNSMLKFLEEPDNNIIAILMTNNFNNLLSTIISRCQVIRLNNDGSRNDDLELSNLVLNFICSLENNKIRTIINEKELIFDNIGTKDRSKLVVFFDKMIDMYYDMLKILNKCKSITFSDYYNELKKISEMNTSKNILDKIEKISEMKENIRNNVNVNLLIDKLIVLIGGM